MTDIEKQRQELINQCRYYKGEEENPYEDEDGDSSLFWFYEQKWVQFSLKGRSNDMQLFLQEYESAGGSDFPNVPSSLIALLFNRYCHFGGASPRSQMENFKKLIRNSYLS